VVAHLERWAKIMKTCFTILLFFAASLRAEIEFSGFFTTSKDAFFSVTDTETQRSSGWLKIGQSFGSYTVLSFDREQDVITLKQGERPLKIPLRASKIKDGRATISGSLKFMHERVEGVRASLFFGEEASFPLANGITFRIKPERRPDGNILYHAKFIAIGEGGTEKVLSAPSVVAIPGQPFGIQIGDFGYSFAP
jgi:hypothetical protein